MKERMISVLDPKHPEYSAHAAKVQEIMKSKDFKAFGELISGMISGEIELEDIVAPILGENTAQEVTGQDQRFEAPLKIIGNKALTIENGVTLPTAKIVGKKVYVAPEYIGTPSYPVDTNDLAAGDLVTAQSIKNYGMQALIVKKCLTMHNLLCSGERMTDKTATDHRVIAIEDDGSYTSLDVPSYIRVVKRTVEDEISKLQDASGGRPTIKAYCRQITLDLLQRAELPNVEWYPLPAANDDNQRPYFTEGDVVLVAPGAALCSRVMDIEASERSDNHFEVSYAFRWGHKWILWDDKYLRRIVIVKRSTVETGTVTVDAMSTTELDLYFSKPVAKSTISKTTVLIDDVIGCTTSVFTGDYTVTIGADLRHVHITFPEALTTGTTYYIKTTTGVQDIYADTNHAFTAMAVTAVTV